MKKFEKFSKCIKSVNINNYFPLRTLKCNEIKGNGLFISEQLVNTNRTVKKEMWLKS